MSRPGTDAFHVKWDDLSGRRPATLAKIELVSPSTQTLYLSSTELFTPDGQFWESGLKAGSIRATVDFLGTGPNPCDATIRIADRRYAFQSSGTIVDAVSQYQWQGAAVTLYLWEQRLTDFADALQVLNGVVDSYSIDDSWLTLNLLQSRTWNKPCPPTVLDKSTYPNAPDGTVGQVVPIVYGNHVDYPMRTPWSASYGTNKTRAQDCGDMAGALPYALVDPGTGAANVKLVAAGHACGKLLDRSNGYTLAIGASDVLNPLDTTGLTETLGSTESYITISDDTMVAYYGVRPTDVRAASTALNGKRAMDPFDETSYATLDQNTGNGSLRLAMPNLPNIGQIISATLVMAYSGDAANAVQHLRAYPKDTASGATGTVLDVGVVTSTTPTTGTVTYDTNFYSAEWHFGDSAAHTVGPIDIIVDFNGGTTQKARIYWVGVSVKYKPQRNVVTPAHWIPPVTRKNKRHWYTPIVKALGGRTPETATVKQGYYGAPAVYSVTAAFFGNGKGYVDDGGGTYTGTASAVIERPCDIVRHFLTVYGLQSAFETGATSFGSFVLARALLKNASPFDFKMAGRIGDLGTVQQYLKEICDQSMTACLFDRFTSKWLFHVWKPGAAQDYPWTFDRTDCPDLFESGVTSDVDLKQGVRVQYGFDHFKGRTLFESFVTANGSSQGYSIPTFRDQKSLVVTAGTNDAFDWSLKRLATGLFDVHYNDTLTAGTYTPIALAQHVQAKMRVHQTDAQVRFGFEVVAGYNDKLDFLYSAVNYTGTLRAGSYNADSFATECARAMNAAGCPITFTVIYTQSTNAFTITGTASWTAKPNGGANRLTSAWYDLGLRGADVAGTSQTSYASRYADRFHIGCSQTVIDQVSGPYTGIRLDFASGTFASTTCANLIGLNGQDSCTALDSYSWAPDGTAATMFAPRGLREATAATSQTLYGPKSDQALVADWIRDESTAQQLRDRMFDFGSTPQVWVKFRTHRAPDMQRMRVIGFSSDMDARRPYPKYGSDGSWAGKTFRVIEVEQDLGPSYHTEIMAMEA